MQTTAIHEFNSRITTTDMVEDPTLQPISISNNTTLSTPRQGVPIITNPSLYTTLQKSNKHYFYLHDMKFYYTFRGDHGLEKSEYFEQGNIYISIDNPNGKGGKCFSIIKDRYALLIKYLSILSELRNFYEVALEYQPQKPRFDVDVDLDKLSPELAREDIIVMTDNVVMCLIDCIQEIMLEHNVPYIRSLHLEVFTSHGPNKRSYHIIVDGFYHKNNKEAEAFYELVCVRVSSKIEYDKNIINIDSAVYSILQNFRLMGSTKIGKNRIKKLDTVLSRTRDESIYSPLDNFYSHMLTTIEDCQQLPTFISNVAIPRNLLITQRTINGAEYDQVLSIFNSYMFPLYSDRNSTMFKLGNFYKPAYTTNDKYLSFNRICPGYCPCHPKNVKDDKHDSVGCFVTVKDTGHVKFHCYSKNPKVKGIIIGKIGAQVQTQTTTNISSTQAKWLASKGIIIQGQSETTTNNDMPLQIITNEKDHESCFWIGGINIKTGEHNPDKCYWPEEPCTASAPIVKSNDIITASLDVTPNIHTLLTANAIINTQTDVPYMGPFVQKRQSAIPIINGQPVLHVEQGATNSNIRMATNDDFILFLRECGCPDPSYHKLPDCYQAYSTYCRNHYLIPQPISTNNNNYIITPINNDNPVFRINEMVAIHTKQVPATHNDIANFLESLRVVDLKSKVSCIDLYNQFIQYCNNNKLLCKYQQRGFTDAIKNITSFTTIKFNRIEHVIGVSLLNSITNNVTSLGYNKIKKDLLSENYISGNKVINLSTTNKYELLPMKTNTSNNIPLLEIMSNNCNTVDNKLLDTTPIYNNNNNTLLTINNTVHHCPINKGYSNINKDSKVSEITSAIFNTLMPTYHCLPEISQSEPRTSEISDVDIFFTEQFIKQDQYKINADIVNECFVRYCENRNIIPSIKCAKLVNLLADRHHVQLLFEGKRKYIIGYKLKNDPREVDDDKARDSYRRIWNNWRDPYMIGCRNGPYPYQLTGPEWEGINITYSDKLPLRSVEEMVTNKEDFVLVIGAGCAGGKTTILRPYIQRSDLEKQIKRRNPETQRMIRSFHEALTNGTDIDMVNITKNALDNYPDDRITVCVNRKSLTNKFIKEFEDLGFKVIKDEGKKNGIITENRVVHCYPSLWRNFTTPDLLIMDEYCSTMKLHFEVTKKKAESFRMLKELMRHTPKVIIADAGLRNRHILDIKRLSKREVTVHQCLAKTQVGKTVFRVKRLGVLVKKIVQSVRQGKRISVPTSSKKAAKIISNKITKEMPNVNVGIFTAEEMAEITGDPVELFPMYQCIVYTGTILAGNSYTEPIDETYGYFLTSTSDWSDIMQMILRCRNLTTGNIYICLEMKGYQDKIIPDDVPATIRAIRKYIMSKARQGIKYLESDKYKIPMDLIERKHTGEIDENGTYFNLYCGYIKDKVLQQRETDFLLMLALRDHGMRFGGYIGRMEYDEEAEETEKEFRNVSKEMNKVSRTETANESELNDEEAKVLFNKETTLKEKKQLIKYKLKKEYGVPVTEELIRKTRGMHVKHNNLVKCARVSGIENEEERRRIMGEIGNSIMKRVDDKYIPEDIVGTIHNIDPLYRVRGCYHALNIMKIAGFGNFIDLIPKSEPKEVNKKLIETYILEHKKDIRYILNLSKDVFISADTENVGDTGNTGNIKYGRVFLGLCPKNSCPEGKKTDRVSSDPDVTTGNAKTMNRISLMGIASALVDKIFGIKIVMLPNTESAYLQSKWKKRDNLILPEGAVMSDNINNRIGTLTLNIISD
jgi:hypothetical protein